MCCWGHHHSRYYRDRPERCYPQRYEGWSPREEYIRQLEEERDMLEQRLRRLEQEVEALRQQTRPTPE